MLPEIVTVPLLTKALQVLSCIGVVTLYVPGVST